MMPSPLPDAAYRSPEALLRALLAMDWAPLEEGRPNWLVSCPLCAAVVKRWIVMGGLDGRLLHAEFHMAAHPGFRVH